MEGKFSKGIAIVPGKVWHREDKKDLYFTFIGCRQTEGYRRNYVLEMKKELLCRKWLKNSW